METLCPELDALLQPRLGRARIQRTRLPDVPELRLWLLDAEFSSASLSPDEIRSAMDYPAYWAFCWASGQVLARHLLDNPSWVLGRTVLDFGCGSGVAAIAAAKAGARRVIACDLDPDARVATEFNARLNAVKLDLAADFWQVRQPLDLILAADVLYDRANMAWLPRFLEHADAALVADSRVRDFSVPDYHRVGGGRSCTWPDLDEDEQFRQVSLYMGTRDR